MVTGNNYYYLIRWRLFMNKYEDTLTEVWEMKEAVYNDFINSKYENIIDYINNEINEIKKEYNIKYRKETASEEPQLKIA